MPDAFASQPAMTSDGRHGEAWFAGVRASGVVECVDVLAEPEKLRTPGFWVVVGEFEGTVRAWRFASVSGRPGGSVPDVAPEAAPWRGPAADGWTSSLDQSQYQDGVAAIRRQIRDGGVYQANLCRVLEASLSRVDGREPQARGLSARLAAENPAPYAGGVHVPTGLAVAPVWVVSASPELFLRIEDGLISSRPIKGTATFPEGLTLKDEAENVMITDLVRNDLQRVCVPGSVEVTNLLGVEHHPGLVHLVSTVQGLLGPEVESSTRAWAHILQATYPPGSVSGAPKSSALDVIDRLEPVPRGPYCGAFGWIDVGPGGELRAELAVAIRTFWWTAGPGPSGSLRFGTGAGITWGSEAEAEWHETELKAARLVALASGDGSGVEAWVP